MLSSTSLHQINRTSNITGRFAGHIPALWIPPHCTRFQTWLYSPCCAHFLAFLEARWLTTPRAPFPLLLPVSYMGRYVDARPLVRDAGTSGEVGRLGDKQQGSRVRVEHFRIHRRRRLPKMVERSKAGEIGWSRESGASGKNGRVCYCMKQHIHASCAALVADLGVLRVAGLPRGHDTFGCDR